MEHAYKLPTPAEHDFRTYLEHSLRDPFAVDLSGCNLLEVVNACAKVKSQRSPNYRDNIGGLVYNLKILEEQYRISLRPEQVTDIFWSYFIPFCQMRGLKASSINTMCSQLRSILRWAVKYNARVSPTFADVNAPKPYIQMIALTADEVSRITYFDIDRFYAGRRSDFRRTMTRVRDMFVLSCNLFQRYSDMVRIEPSCFERGIFRIRQLKTGNLAVVNIDKYAVDAKTTYRILDMYAYFAPYRHEIGNYNYALHELMRDVGLDDPVRIEEKGFAGITTVTVPKWRLISSHTARRTAITINVMRGYNIHALKRCSGHTDLRSFDKYVRDNEQ